MWLQQEKRGQGENPVSMKFCYVVVPATDNYVR